RRRTPPPPGGEGPALSTPLARAALAGLALRARAGPPRAEEGDEPAPSKAHPQPRGPPVSSTSVTTWLERLQADDPRAAQALWERFAQRMLAAARQRLGSAPRRVADEEDVVVVAFRRFLDGVRAGRSPRRNDRDDVWAVLLTLIQRTSLGQRRDLARQKRGGGAVAGDSALVTAGGRAIEPPDEGPTPEEAAAWRDELERLLAALGDEE